MPAANSLANPVAIRTVRPDDAAALRELRLEALSSCPTAFCTDPSELDAKPMEWWAEYAVKNSGNGEEAMFVADRAGRLVGMAGVYGSTRPKITHRATIFGVYVRPEARGLGLCAGLIDAAIEWAVTKQKAIVDLAVTVGNDTALRCYERAGFTTFGRQPMVMRLGGVYHDEWLMAKRL